MNQAEQEDGAISGREKADGPNKYMEMQHAVNLMRTGGIYVLVSAGNPFRSESTWKRSLWPPVQHIDSDLHLDTNPISSLAQIKMGEAASRGLKRSWLRPRRPGREAWLRV